MELDEKLGELNELLESIKQKIDELESQIYKIQYNMYEIAEYLVQYFANKGQAGYYFMMNDRSIYEIHSYRDLIKSNKITPDDAKVYIWNRYCTKLYPPISNYLYPFLFDVYFLYIALLSKLGVNADFYDVAPATGLIYIAVVFNFEKIGRIVVEVADFNNVITNAGLQTLIQRHDVLGKKDMTSDEVREFISRFKVKKLFAGYDFAKARRAIKAYYEENYTPLVEDVKAITEAYYKIFQPYRAVYDIKTKQFIFK
jgi:hypothetical protein